MGPNSISLTQRFKLNKIEKPIYVRNIDGLFSKKLVEYMVEMNIYYQKYKERIEINVIKGRSGV